MKTVVLLSALLGISVAAPMQQEHISEDSILKPELFPLEKSVKIGLIPVAHQPIIHRRPIIIKKKLGYHLYRNSDEEKAQSDSEECSKQVKVKLCDETARDSIKNIDQSGSDDSHIENDMEHSIKMAKEAVENLQKNLLRMERSSIKQKNHWKHSDAKEDIEMHENIELAKKALQHFENNFGDLEAALQVTDTSNGISGKSEAERLVQWKNAIETIQKNIDIANNIEESFKSTSQSEIPLTSNNKEMENMESQPSDMKSSDTMIEMSHQSPINLESLSQVKEMNSVNELKESETELPVTSSGLEKSDNGEFPLKSSDEEESSPIDNSETTFQERMGLEENNHETEKKSEVDTTSLMKSTIENENNLDLLSKQTSEKVVTDSINGPFTTETKSTHDENKILEKSITSTDSTSQHLEEKLQESDQSNKAETAAKTTVSNLESTLDQSQQTSNLEHTFVAPSERYQESMKQEKSDSMDEAMHMSFKNSIFSPSQRHNMQWDKKHGLSRMAYGSEPGHGAQVASFGQANIISSGANAVMPSNSGGIRLRPVMSGVGSNGLGFAAASGDSNGQGAVGLFPNAKVGGCAIPLLLSCSPSVQSGSLAKAHPAYSSAPQYRTSEDFAYHNKRETVKSHSFPLSQLKHTVIRQKV